jgi:hypothetical protein
MKNVDNIKIHGKTIKKYAPYNCKKKKKKPLVSE